jgi:hypothetical protein
MNRSSSSSGGVSFLGLLTLALIGLKLCDVIQWSWWLVFSPLIIAVVMLIVLLAFVYTVICK